MLMIILSLHIFVAIVMSLAIVGVFVAARAERETKIYDVMLGSFVATVVSGIGLLFVSPGGFGRLCVMMTAFTSLVVVARLYYRKRVVTAASL